MIKTKELKIKKLKKTKINVIISRTDYKYKEFIKINMEEYFSSKKFGSAISVSEFRFKYFHIHFMFERNDMEVEEIILSSNEIPVLKKIIVKK